MPFPLHPPSLLRPRELLRLRAFLRPRALRRSPPRLPRAPTPHVALSGRSFSARAAVLAVSFAALSAGCDGEGAPPEDRNLLADVRFDTVATVGAIDGEEWEIFSRIESVVVGEDGRFAVLDPRTPSVSLFDPDGRFLDAVASQGQGPGELRSPTGLAWRGEDLLVLDVPNGRLSIFDSGDGDLAFEEMLQARIWGLGSLCADGDRVLISAFAEDGIIHELGADGEATRSFSAPPEPEGMDGIEDPLRRIAMEDLASSWIRCDVAPGNVLEVGILNPRIRLLEGAGAVLWETRAEPFFQMRPEVVNGGGIGIRVDEEDGAHLARSVVPWDREHVLVQYERRYLGSRPEGREFHALESRLYRLDDGAEVGRSDVLPFVVDARDGRLFHVRQEPFPQVVVLERW